MEEQALALLSGKRRPDGVLSLWTDVALAVSAAAQKLKLVTGRDLAQACRDAYPRWACYVLFVLCEIAIAASHEFGAPLLDLDAIQPDLETIQLVSEKILRKHRAEIESQARRPRD